SILEEFCSPILHLIARYHSPTSQKTQTRIVHKPALTLINKTQPSLDCQVTLSKTKGGSIWISIPKLQGGSMNSCVDHAEDVSTLAPDWNDKAVDMIGNAGPIYSPYHDQSSLSSHDEGHHNLGLPWSEQPPVFSCNILPQRRSQSNTTNFVISRSDGPVKPDHIWNTALDACGLVTPNFGYLSTQSTYGDIRDLAPSSRTNHFGPPSGLAKQSVERISKLDRDARNEYLREARRHGLSYKDTKHHGDSTEAESTLRGRHRILSKPKEMRVRNPRWNYLRLEIYQRQHQEIPELPFIQIMHTSAFTYTAARGAAQVVLSLEKQSRKIWPSV
ncbi:hypothetical protein KCU90_g21531, partial [Aureobasidium melanogenum]